ncbi:MAG: RNA methyltransferase [Coriobacteriales bacterium]|jgi:16S rRNA (uracil1498-N3)-methyltransferase|nr:RNA methyltransferase [Coriobacteriales bacterium]
MTIPHFFIESSLVAGSDGYLSVPIERETLDHMRSLRLKAGEHIVLVPGDVPGQGTELELTGEPVRGDTHIQGRMVRILHDCIRERLTLVQGISASERMDQTIRQVTELGVERIIPLQSERSTVRLDAHAAGAKLERWKRIARSAAEQSARLTLPELLTPGGLAGALELLAEYDGIIVAWEESEGHSLGEAVARIVATTAVSASSTASAAPRVALSIGPEGGFSAQEIAILTEAGAQVVSLGATILRTETAAVVASALVLYHLGALGAR